MRVTWSFLPLALVILAACNGEAPAQPSTSAAQPPTTEVRTFDPSAIYGLDAKALDGAAVSFADWRGKAVLFVNTASRCGYTPQYEGLETLHDRYGDRGLVVAGFPCNQFGGQEPGGAEEIRSFCTSKYGVSFPMFAKVEVNGAGRHPLYGLLTQAADGEGTAGDVKWNFEKFLLSADGKTVKRFRSGVEPESDEMITAIEAALPKS